jgi:DMSO reductase family type II enzyme chaperone
MSDRPVTPTRFDAPGAPRGPGLGPADLALCRSALWEALALGFRAPTDDTVARLASADGAAALAAAAAALDGAEGGALAPRVEALGEGPAPGLRELQAAYQQLFGHTARGRVPPYETEYGDDAPFLPPREMSDLMAFFRAFGLVLRADAHERPDHIACECEFLLTLARKEAYALEVGDEAMLVSTRQAGRLFLREHLGRWAPGFGMKLAREAAGFYGRLGDLAATFVTRECGRLGVTAGPALLRLRSPEEADAPMACGSLPAAEPA